MEVTVSHPNVVSYREHKLFGAFGPDLPSRNRDLNPPQPKWVCRPPLVNASTVWGVVTTRESSGGDTNVRQTIAVRNRLGCEQAR
jgi:hypothetical protein